MKPFPFFSAFVFAALSALASTAQAFMPATGAWGIDSEMNGTSGRGFNIEVENEVMVFTYYGYRADGSSLFYVAAGPITNNVFTAALTDYRGGTPIGDSYRSATAQGSAGNVSISFSNGLKGVLTLPGESPKAVSKFSFGYASTPQGLLGSYLFAYVSPPPARPVDYYTLSRVTGLSTANGNGLVTDATTTFSCENMVSGSLAGNTVCLESTSNPLDDQYFFKMSGDRGAGFGSWMSAGATYAVNVLRTATVTGRQTGINDGTAASLLSSSSAPAAAAVAMAQSQSDQYLKSLEQGTPGPSLAPGIAAALNDWAAEARVLMQRPAGQ